MNIAHAEELTSQKSLRLWPGVIAVVLQWLVWLVVPMIISGAVPYGVIGGIVGDW
ncbi:MAG: hypothetical protein IPJ07_06520 [Acidobacteria bacterium]|nr:hypothetical protein [Acidobacteriota bacterium]